MIIFCICTLGNDRKMEGEASYYLGLAHLAAGEHDTALTVSWTKCLSVPTLNFCFIIFYFIVCCYKSNRYGPYSSAHIDTNA